MGRSAVQYDPATFDLQCRFARHYGDNDRHSSHLLSYGTSISNVIEILYRPHALILEKRTEACVNVILVPEGAFAHPLRLHRDRRYPRVQFKSLKFAHLTASEHKQSSRDAASAVVFFGARATAQGTQQVHSAVEAMASTQRARRSDTRARIVTNRLPTRDRMEDTFMEHARRAR